jgi:hypothetical protein
MGCPIAHDGFGDMVRLDQVVGSDDRHPGPLPGRTHNTQDEAAAEIARADEYFMGELGFDYDTPLRVPENRSL